MAQEQRKPKADENWTRAEQTGKKVRDLLHRMVNESVGLAQNLRDATTDVSFLEQAVTGDISGLPPAISAAIDSANGRLVALKREDEKAWSIIERKARQTYALRAEMEKYAIKLEAELASIGTAIGELHGAVCGKDGEPGEDPESDRKTPR